MAAGFEAGSNRGSELVFSTSSVDVRIYAPLQMGFTHAKPGFFFDPHSLPYICTLPQAEHILKCPVT